MILKGWGAGLLIDKLFFWGGHTVAYGGSQVRGRIRAAAVAYTTATAMQDPSHILDLHLSSQHCQILNPLSKAKDGTRILMDTSLVLYH